MITRNFNLFLNAGNSIPLVINANQYDSGEQWVFTLYSEDGTQYVPSSGAIVGIKSDGLGIINTASVVDGKVVVTETQQMTAAAGKAEFELMIDAQTHGTANFVVMVEPKPGDNADLSESDYSLLQEAINSTSQEIVNQSISDWMDENLTPTTPVVDSSLTISGAAADAKKTGDEISDLKSQIEHIDVETDTTLSVSGKPADAYTTGNRISSVQSLANNKASASYNADENTLTVVYGTMQAMDVPTTDYFITSSEISEVLTG